MDCSREAGDALLASMACSSQEELATGRGGMQRACRLSCLNGLGLEGRVLGLPDDDVQLVHLHVDVLPRLVAHACCTTALLVGSWHGAVTGLADSGQRKRRAQTRFPLIHPVAYKATPCRAHEWTTAMVRHVLGP